MGFFKPRWAVEWLELLKQEGFKGFLKKKGWKVVAAFFLFYLVRDVTLYIILPYFAITKLGGCG
jgi:hypothetical protein